MHLYLGLPLLERAAREVLGRRKTAVRLRELSGHQDPLISNLLEQIRAEVMDQKKSSDLFLAGLGQCLAVYLIRKYRDETAAASLVSAGLPAYKLSKVLALMQSRLDQEFELEPLARTVNLSVFHFSRLFKRATGFAPSRYFIRLRMARARRLLRESDRSIIDIGLDVGYGSPSHFAQLFRRETGVTPTAYRG
jgi:AraC family transcriptional regulator